MTQQPTIYLIVGIGIWCIYTWSIEITQRMEVEKQFEYTKGVRHIISMFDEVDIIDKGFMG